MNNNENNLFFKEEVGGSVLPIHGIMEKSNQNAESSIRKANHSLMINLKKDLGPLHVWKCISCNKKFEKPLYSHRECPYCGSDLVVLVDINQL